MAPSSTGSNNNNQDESSVMALANNPDMALALLQATSPNGVGSSNGGNSNPTNAQGPSDAMPNANNMLVSGRGTTNGSRSTANKSSKLSAASSSSTPAMPQPRPSSTARGNVAAFLTKLYNMVNDEASNNLIKWSDDGQSFLVLRHVDFAKEVLPKFFKHNNFSSFVRQLNMYGFHKVPHLQQGVLLPDSDSEQWEFSNPHFQKNQPDLLCLVSRKKASNGNEDKDPFTMDLGHILQEVTAIKKHQIAISSDLKSIERDHQSLWQESVAARERHQRQQETIDKILRFLASVFSGDKKRAIVPNKRPRLTITDGELDDDYEHEVSQESEGEHEEEVTKLLGSKRKRASMVESEADCILPGMEAHGSPKAKPTFSVDKMTPASLALLANANKSAQSNPASSFSNPTFTPTPIPTSTTATSSRGALPTVPDAASSLPDYLTSLPATNYANQSFKLDPSNLAIPTAFLPNSISPMHHDMLRSISMANAQETAPAPLPPSFAQTPAGANVVKGVDDIAKEMEQLQKSIEALEAHGLNVDDFNFDNNYLNSDAFDPSAYGDLTSISESGIPYQDTLENENGAMDDMIHADQDDLDFITPELSHQHISSGQMTPVSSVNSPNVSSVQTPVSILPNSVCPASPPNDTPADTASSPPTPASFVSAHSANTVNLGTSTAGGECLEDLLHTDAV
ncbi:stress-responsive transcription factor hsf1 [Mortierella sp. AD011]|nr:stress-responsive transcription factor hsf1 [Mortierella sp. AD010]KAF9402945.1 stress-responsive transcription factor hsf1 [Mortierella sp. AD011]